MTLSQPKKSDFEQKVPGENGQNHPKIQFKEWDKNPIVSNSVEKPKKKCPQILPGKSGHE